MITDKETNFVYISDLLERQSPIAYKQLKSWFQKLEIDFELIPNTRDLWLVDFMPIQVREGLQVLYKYDPDYLKDKQYQNSKTDQKLVCDSLGLIPNRTSIVIDGGNIVKHKSKAILTTKIFKENSNYPEQNLINEIRNQLELDQIIIIPQEPGDIIGHADGMVRFVNENTVLLNRYPETKIYKEFGFSLRASLRNAGLSIIEFPYDSWQNESADDATGCYINFLETGQYIFYPVYAAHNDQLAEIQLRKAYPDRELIAIDSRDLAKLGGVLNCATWNIKV